MKKKPTNRDHFASSNEKAKSRIVVRMVRLARKERLDYTDFIYVCQQARKKLGLRRPKKERKLPQLLPEAELKKFFRVIHQCGNLQHEIIRDRRIATSYSQRAFGWCCKAICALTRRTGISLRRHAACPSRHDAGDRSSSSIAMRLGVLNTSIRTSSAHR